MAAVAVTIVFSSLFLSVSLATEDAFHEELIMRPLSTGHVYAHFQFSTVWHVDVEDPKACKLLGKFFVKLKYISILLDRTQKQNGSPGAFRFFQGRRRRLAARHP